MATVAGDLNAGLGNAAGSTLAYVSGEDVSTLDVAGIATLADSSANTTYDLLTAADIVADLGTISFSGPAGYGLQIVTGGNGEILQAVVPGPTSLALLGLAGFALRRRRA